MPALNVLQVGRVSGNPSFQFADDSPSEYSSDSDDVNTAAAAAVKLLHSCPTLRDPIDGSPPGYPFPGILQAKTPEWLAISFSNA